MIEKDLSTKLLKIWSINLFLLQESIFKMVNNYTVEADKNELLIRCQHNKTDVGDRSDILWKREMQKSKSGYI